MKTNVRMVASTLLITLVLASCSNQGGQATKDEANRGFASPEEAAAKAQSDLLQALESRQVLNLGVDAARLREARVGKLTRHAEVDFQKLAATDSITSLTEIVAGERGMLAPFIAGNEVVAVAEIARVAGSWKPTVLGNKQVADDLNLIGPAVRDSILAVYEVPNLNVTIYEARDTYFLTFDQFSPPKGVSLSAFYPGLRDSARAFETRFGEQLRKGKLVK